MQRKKKVFSRNDKLRVKKSYYTFSKEYPQGYIRIQRSKRIGKKQIRKIALYCAVFLLLTGLSYFVVNLGLELSYKPIDSTEQPTVESAEPSVLVNEGVRALYMPYTRLGDDDYLRYIVREIRKKDGNSVVIDFKTAEGKLAYTSMQENAIIGKCAVYDNDTVRRALNVFRQADIAVIARVYCLRDSIVPVYNPDLAVKYMGTDVNWLDGSDENGGKPWLNPYSKSVRNYIVSVIGELNNLGINAFILESLQFPDGENTAGATYPGEKKQSERNGILKNLIGQIKKKLPENAVLIFSESANDAIDGNNGIYFGSMTDISLYGVAVDTMRRPISVAVDKKTDFISIMSLYTTVSQRFSGKSIIPIIDVEEYSYSYFRAMKKSGYQSFILFSETGEY